MNRTKGILAAGTLTGLVLVTLLALGFRNIGVKTDEGAATAVPEPTPIVVEEQPVDNSADEAAIQAWQEYTAQLENTVNTMQSRENEYQVQLDSANQTIIQLQDQINSANAAPVVNSAPASYEDDDDDRHEEHEEHEEHEDEEREDDDD